MLALHFVSSPLAARLCALSLRRIFGRARIHFPLSSGHVPRRVGAALPREPLLRQDEARILRRCGRPPLRRFVETLAPGHPPLRQEPSCHGATAPAPAGSPPLRRELSPTRISSSLGAAAPARRTGGRPSLPARAPILYACCREERRKRNGRRKKRG